MKFILLIISIFICASALTSNARAESVYQKPEIFISESFEGQPPSPKTISINEALAEKVGRIMGTHYRLTQTQYWQDGSGRTAWILEDIGKYKPITTGFVVGNDGALERLKVLIYRESHGWEVRHKFFTRQFEGVELKKSGKKLDTRIDGIAGATLSVNTLKRLSALALLLHKEVSS